MKKWVFTCEHAGNDIPENYASLFQRHHHVLQTHRAIDLGSKEAYEVLRQNADFAHAQYFSRLLIEVNRSLHHPKLFSEFTKNLNRREKQQIIERYYLPYRKEVESEIRGFIQKNQEVVHISVHTFTPELDGIVRNTDIGLLFDPSRPAEKSFCHFWKHKITAVMPDFKVRFNYPYLGKSDGFVTYLRKLFPINYVGIELEINQKHQTQIQNIAFKLLKSLPKTST